MKNKIVFYFRAVPYTEKHSTFFKDYSMNQAEAVKKIRESLEDGKTEDALEQLVQFLKGVNAPSQDDAILLLGQYKQWERENRIGVQQSTSELRRIELSIMDMLRDEDLTTSPASQGRYGAAQTGRSNQGNNGTNGLLYTIIGALVVLLLGAMFFMTSSNNEQQSSTTQTPTENIAETNPKESTEDTEVSNDAELTNHSPVTPAPSVSNSIYSIEAVSGDSQTYGGGGMHKPMVIRIKNKQTQNYVQDLRQEGIEIQATANVDGGKYDGPFSNFNDYCNTGDKSCYGGYYYVPSNSGGTAYTLAVTVTIVKDGQEIDSYVFNQNIR